jgi:hypothetical protein
MVRYEPDILSTTFLITVLLCNLTYKMYLGGLMDTRFTCKVYVCVAENVRRPHCNHLCYNTRTIKQFDDQSYLEQC